MPAYTTRTTPTTFIIARDNPIYGDMDEVFQWIAEAPPRIHHGGDDMAYTPHGLRIPPRAEVDDAEARVRRWTKGLRDLGVEIFMPYVCNGHIFGHPDNETGMWDFLKHWDEHADKIGPKPDVDPIEWIQREPDGRPHFNYPFRMPVASYDYEYAGCVMNPHWAGWLNIIIKLIAESGYNAVFIDNNIHHCYCEHCNGAFKDYLTETYTPEQMKHRFGTSDVSTLNLTPAGDRTIWASRQEDYLPWILEREPEEFQKLFGTDKVEEAVASEGGNGFHWGRSTDFWHEYLKKTYSEEETERILRRGDISTLGCTTREELCLWADTNRFWAWAIGVWQNRLRSAARTVCEDFITVPNWGDMAGYRHVDARRLEGKNPRLWKRGTDIVFYEQEYLPAFVAPGYVFDLIIPHKYSAACGLRVSMLPYRGADQRALCELTTAEAAAFSGDGMHIEVRYKFPENRRTYQAFYDSHAEWYAGRTSAADVGLVFSFDELHMENPYHLREVYSLAHYMLDHHVLFDFLTEGQITLEELRRFRLVILPHVQYLSAEERQAVKAYVNEGGRVLVTSNTGAFDEHACPWTEGGLLAETLTEGWIDDHSGEVSRFAEGRLWKVNDIAALLPKRKWEIHDLMNVPFPELYEGDMLVNDVVEAAKSECDDPAVLELLNELGGTSLPVLGADAPLTLRCAAWDKPGDSMVLHLVNYHIPAGIVQANIHEPKERQVEPVPAENVRVALPVDDPAKVTEVLLANPWNPDPVALDFTIENGRVTFIVPKVDIYQVVKIG